MADKSRVYLPICLLIRKQGKEALGVLAKKAKETPQKVWEEGSQESHTR